MSTICSRNASLVLRDQSISSRSEGWDTSEVLFADRANGALCSLLDVLSNQFTSWGSDGSNLVGSSVVTSSSSVGDSWCHLFNW